MTEPQGYLSLILHAHLPFVRHPEHPVFLEENWLFEAITECYVPLLAMLDRLAEDNVDGRLTLSVSPTLCEMLGDELLRERYRRRLHLLLELAEREEERTRHEPELHALAGYYHRRLSEVRRLYEDVYRQDLVGAWRRLAEAERVELIACAATHALLPLLGSDAARRAQIRQGVATYRRHFGRAPLGFWLPECAYVPGLDELLAAEGIRYFVLDSHGLLFGYPRPARGTFAPILCPSRIAAFARDPESSKQVWSAQTGYPGDPLYREFYRDLGHDAEADYIAPYLIPGCGRHDLGFKYHRVTGSVPLSAKELYAPEAARQRTAVHAGNFLFNRGCQLEDARRRLGLAPLAVAPFDAELFGHWWYEGPDFLAAVLRRESGERRLELITPGDYLRRAPHLQAQQPSASSWGDKGYFEVWLNGGNDWIYPRLHAAEAALREAAAAPANRSVLPSRILNQAMRELFLAQSSDWAFIMTTGSMQEYAIRRVEEHLDRCQRLLEMLESGRHSEELLSELESRDNLFPDLCCRTLLT